MAIYTEDDATEAERLISRLLNREFRDINIQENLETFPRLRDLSIVDLEEDTEQFLDEMEFLSFVNLPAPALRIGRENTELVPMALNTLGFRWPLYGYSRYRKSRRFPYEFYADLLYHEVGHQIETNERTQSNFTSIPVDEARSIFQRLAIDFLANRIAGLRELKLNNLFKLTMFQNKKGPSITTSGCHFSVSTNSPGLRVLWSGAYRISKNNFSSPTTPTSSVLQSGTYVFGVDGGAYGNNTQWDDAIVILPGNPSVHLNY